MWRDIAEKIKSKFQAAPTKPSGQSGDEGAA